MSKRPVLSIFIITLCMLPNLYAKIELCPMAGYGFGGSFEERTSSDPDNSTKLDIDEAGLGALALDWDITDNSQYELYFSHQKSKLTENGGIANSQSLFDMDITYLHFGGTLGFGDDRVDPFIVGTLGLTHFDPQDTAQSSKTNFSLALGGGVKLYITEHIGWRFEGRGLGTLVNGSMWFHSGSGGAAIGIAGDSLWQFQLNTGLIIAF